jgi:alpha-L-fucosidase
MNGVTLLSLAPLPDGTLPPSQVETMKKLGVWMAINKTALYASKPAPFSEGGPGVSKAGSIRFTTKGNYLYAIDLEKPDAPFEIPGVQPVKDSKITMLGSSDELTWHQEGNNVVIENIPDPLPCDYAWSFKIQYKQ